VLAGPLLKQRQFLNVIKHLGNELQIPIVAAGGALKKRKILYAKAAWLVEIWRRSGLKPPGAISVRCSRARRISGLVRPPNRGRFGRAGKGGMAEDSYATCASTSIGAGRSSTIATTKA
jgi:hypothetical protein